MNCAKCGAEVPDRSDYCPSCGDRADRGSSLTASDIVQLFADRFAEVRDEGYDAPCSGVKVRLRTLVNTMLAGAFVALAESGFLNLTKAQKKGLFTKSDVVQISVLDASKASLAGIEKGLWDTLLANPTRTTAGEIVRRLVGQKTMEPFSTVTGLSIENARAAGYYRQLEQMSVAVRAMAGKTIPVPLTPICDRIASLSGRADEVKRMLDRFEAANPEVYTLLHSEVDRTIQSVYRMS